MKRPCSRFRRIRISRTSSCYRGIRGKFRLCLRSLCKSASACDKRYLKFFMVLSLMRWTGIGQSPKHRDRTIRTHHTPGLKKPIQKKRHTRVNWYWMPPLPNRQFAIPPRPLQLTKLLASKESAGSRPAWWLEFGRITQWEGAVLWMSAGFSQISDAIRAGRLRESLSLSWWNKEHGC